MLPVGTFSKNGRFLLDIVGNPVKITFMHSNENVNQVNEVKTVVHDVPAYRSNVLKFPKDGSPDHKNEIVKDGAVDYT